MQKSGFDSSDSQSLRVGRLQDSQDPGSESLIEAELV